MTPQQEHALAHPVRSPGDVRPEHAVRILGATVVVTVALPGPWWPLDGPLWHAQVIPESLAEVSTHYRDREERTRLVRQCWLALDGVGHQDRGTAFLEGAFHYWRSLTEAERSGLSIF